MLRRARSYKWGPTRLNSASAGKELRLQRIVRPSPKGTGAHDLITVPDYSSGMAKQMSERPTMGTAVDVGIKDRKPEAPSRDCGEHQQSEKNRSWQRGRICPT